MEQNSQSNSHLRSIKGLGLGLVVASVGVIIVTAGLVLGYDLVLGRQTTELEKQASQGVNVLVMQVGQTPSAETLDIPATIHGYIETPVYAKVAGYLEKLMVDKGDRIRKGQSLAILDTPELDKQVADARANYWLQAVTDRRNRILVRQGVIAQQIADDSLSAMLQAKAYYQQLLAMQSYKQIIAPFNGVVTARYTDPGTLIPQSTASTTGTPIISIATLSPLRVYANVPQTDALGIRNGDSAMITTYELPGRTFKGPIIRHPEALDPASRTMLVEVDLTNDPVTLLPGMYARMKTRVQQAATGLTIRDDALVFREGRVYAPIVRDDKLNLVPVTLGYDDGMQVEVTGDINANDIVALNIGQAAEDGELVKPIRYTQQ